MMSSSTEAWRYVAHIARGEYEEAYHVIREANPFPSVMGRVCPAPCETGCNRNALEDHVGINSVEHFLGEYAIANNLAYHTSAKPISCPGYRSRSSKPEQCYANRTGFASN